jgi:dTDP-4-dehydrorhamnose 3,5-epimerase
MKESSIDGLQVIDVKNYFDLRGNLLPLNFEDLATSLGSPYFSQINIATSHQGVIRGMHWQTEPTPQGKLIKVLFGQIIDIAIDIRPDSSSFGKFHAIKLDENSEKAFWIPPGFAHGFQTLSAHSKVMYLVNAPFDLNCSDGINPLDKELSLPWDNSLRPILSEKDESAATFCEKFNQ